MSVQLGNLNLFARDIEKTRRFYIEALGLQEITERSHPPTFFLLSVGNCTLTLQDASSPGAGFESGTNLEIGFAVEDVDAVRETLRLFGAEVSEVQQMGWGGGFDARDPDGRRLTIFKMRK